MIYPTSYFHYLPHDVPALPAGRTLMINAEERIVTLLVQGQVCAQCRFSRSAFRMMVILLKAPNGAEYAEMLACLHCPEAVFHQVLQASSYQQVQAILGPMAQWWNHYLEQAALGERSQLERELKIVRRVARERSGVDSQLRKHGFPLTVRALYRKGYLLMREPGQKAPVLNMGMPAFASGD